MSDRKLATNEQIQDRMEDLSRQIRHHRFLYYVLNQPAISDAQFDKLYHELEDLEKRYPHLANPDSPTKEVGAAPSTEFKPVKHGVPMLSLANANSDEELVKWQERLEERIKKLSQTEKFSYVCELKIDGLSIALTYKRGILTQGATRGNGEIGEDITLNLKTLPSVPHQLKSPAKGTTKIKKIPELLEVRGEVYMPRESFAALNEQLQNNGQPLLPTHAMPPLVRCARKTREKLSSVDWLFLLILLMLSTLIYLNQPAILKPCPCLKTWVLRLSQIACWLLICRLLKNIAGNGQASGINCLIKLMAWL